MCYAQDHPKDSVILSTDGKMKGIVTGGQRRCRMEGCPGMRIATRWPDGKLTLPCSRGLVFDKKRKAWKIG